MKIKVGVFFGGRSVEHEVSIISAIQAIHNMDKEKYDIVPIYISKKGAWYTGSQLFDIDNYKDINKLLSSCNKVLLFNNTEDNKKTMLKYPLGLFKNVLDNIDVAFPILHGSHGEDGTMQGFFEAIDIPYVGCDIGSSSIGMDKIMTKKVLKEAGIPVVDYIWFYSEEWLRDDSALIQKIESKLGYPLVVKPCNVGSSVGITKVANREELMDAVDLARKYSRKLLIEKMVTGMREINCSVLGDCYDATPSVCEEPVTSNDILTYQDKYMNNSTKGMTGAKRRIPADLPDETSKTIQTLAVETFRELGCSGVIRIDFMLDADNHIFVNEVNTIPGSLSFYLWEPTGKKYSELLDEMIKIAVKRHKESSELIFSYDTNLLSSGGIKGLKK